VQALGVIPFFSGLKGGDPEPDWVVAGLVCPTADAGPESMFRTSGGSLRLRSGPPGRGWFCYGIRPNVDDSGEIVLAQGESSRCFRARLDCEISREQMVLQHYVEAVDKAARLRLFAPTESSCRAVPRAYCAAFENEWLRLRYHDQRREKWLSYSCYERSEHCPRPGATLLHASMEQYCVPVD
jgi:hypothetical protein